MQHYKNIKSVNFQIKKQQKIYFFSKYKCKMIFSNETHPERVMQLKFYFCSSRPDDAIESVATHSSTTISQSFAFPISMPFLFGCSRI